MKRREVKKYLFDVDQSCDLIRQFTEGITFSQYAASPMIRSAVERQFEIIGEALAQALLTYPELQSRISNIGRIIAFRNRLIHGYASVSDEIVWGTIEANLDILKKEVQLLLKELPDQ
jgi:uncharacterized protein with HEPN domain